MKTIQPVIAISLLLLIAVHCASVEKREDTAGAAPIIDHSLTMKYEFDAIYEDLIKKTRTGELPAVTAKQVSALKGALEGYLNAVSVRMQTLEQTILHASEDQREQGLAQYKILTAERERIGLFYLDWIQRIRVSNGHGTKTMQNGPAAADRNKRVTSPPMKSSGPSRDLDIHIEIKPEDIGDGARE